MGGGYKKGVGKMKQTIAKKEVTGKKDGSIDMTQGSPYRLIFLFSMPLLLGNVLQQLYNMVDSIIVGNVVGTKALAAVGTGFPVIFMMCSLFMGVGTGATIMVSQYFGAKDYDSLQDTVSTIYSAMLVGVVPLTLIGMLLSKPLLVMMHVPDDGTLAMASQYMLIIFLGIIGTIGYNVNSGILQGLGDSRTSLIFLAIATVINIVLDLVFTAGIKMGVSGVALATIIAQISSWLFGVKYIQKKYSFIKISFRHLSFNKVLFKQALRLGIPSGIQQALFSVGTMVLQSLVNSYGSAFMAGFNGANKIDTFAFMPVQSFSIAVTTYVGQNIGAKKMERVKHGVRSSMILAGASCLIIGAIIFPLSGTLMRMFSQEEEVIASGVVYLQTVLPFYILLAASFIYNGALRGSGEMVVPLISSVIGLWLARVPAAYLLAHYFGSGYIYYSYAIGWVFAVAISCLYYRTGRWKNKGIVADKN